MKKILYALMLVLGMSVLSSCSKEGNGTSIVGTWEYTDKSWYDGEECAVYFQFKDNGTYVSVDIDNYRSNDFRSYVYYGTWSLSEDTLILDDVEKYPVLELTKDSLTLVLDGKVTFKRVSDSVIKKYL